MIKIQTNVYDSSTIEASTYEYHSKNLYVAFKHATYRYKEVPVEIYNLFIDAESQGIALNELIKGKFEYEKLAQ
jgi:hypothetical protein